MAKAKKQKKPYQKPIIVTYTEEELWDIIGPAQTLGSPEFPSHGLHLGWDKGKGNPHR
jgi:hypothetical protein